MRILLYTTNFYGGGAQKITVNLANYYASKKNDVFILVSSSDGPYKHQISKEVQIIDLGDKRSNKSIFKIPKFIKYYKPDYIISNMRISNIIMGLSLYLFINNSRIIFLEANTMTSLKYSFFMKRLFYKFFMNIAYRKCSVVIANSKDTLSDLKDFLFIKIKIKLLGNPVIDENFKINKNFNYDFYLNNKQSKILISAGSFDKQKNFFLLYNVFKYLIANHDIKLVILGDGPDRNKILNQAKKDRIAEHLFLPGFVTNPIDYFYLSDVFILTSLWEGFGNVLVESLYAKLPIVSVNCPGGPKDIIGDNKFGVLVKDYNIENIANEVVSILTKQKNYDFLKIRSLDYTVEKIAEKYLKI